MKLTITTAIFLLIIGTAGAQHINIGIKGGLNAYTLTSGSVFDNDLKIGMHLGLIGHIHLANPIALQPEIVFSMQGSGNTNLNYINVPFMFQYMYDNGFRIQAGPQVGVLVSAKSGDTKVMDDYQSLDLALGIGVSYVNPATNFGVDVRYNHGLTNVLANNDSKLFNRGFQVGVFYLFNHR
jgi:hypothetical protein